jgi:hypothetical protein
MDIPDWLSAVDSAGLDALHGTFTTRGAGGDFTVARNVITRILIGSGGEP